MSNAWCLLSASWWLTLTLCRGWLNLDRPELRWEHQPTTHQPPTNNPRCRANGNPEMEWSKLHHSYAVNWILFQYFYLWQQPHWLGRILHLLLAACVIYWYTRAKLWVSWGAREGYNFLFFPLHLSRRLEKRKSARLQVWVCVKIS